MHRLRRLFPFSFLTFASLFASPRSPSFPQTQSHPPIPIRFHLNQPSFVTLVIEDQHGQRVRNLVSETRFSAGDNVVWWDGLDDLERDPNSSQHGVFYIPGKLVSPATYVVRGIYRQPIDLKYEFSVYNPGEPPWETADSTSAWLTNHTPAGTLCFIPGGIVPVHGKRDANSPPQMLAGSYVAEGGSGLAWLDLDGRKLHGQQWVGGLWTGAEQITRDPGKHPVPGVYAYIASTLKGELRLHKLRSDKKGEQTQDPRLGSGEDAPVLAATWKFPKPETESLAGLAAYNGVLFVSLPKMNAVLVVDVAASRVIGTFPLSNPRGLFVDGEGNLFAVSDKKVVKFALPEKIASPSILAKPEAFAASGFDDPQQITMDSAGNLYVSDWGKSNQVKVASPAGVVTRTIGTAGVPVSGPYDPLLMHHPKGIALDSRNQLWVAEEDFQPKRISIWSLHGRLIRAFYGGSTYGGGGNLDPQDKTLFYLNGMTFRLDWNSGESKLIALHHRFTESELQLVPSSPAGDKNAPFQEPGSRHKRFGASENPDLPIYANGHKYFTNAYNTDPTSGTSLSGLWIDRDGVALPVAALGNAAHWPILRDPAFHSRLPLALNRPGGKEPDLSAYLFLWSDLNGDGAVQPSEVTIVPGAVRTVTVSADLEFVTDTARSYKPVAFTANGAPIYDPAKVTQLYSLTQRPNSSGGGQVLSTGGNWTILTTAPKPFSTESLAGAEHGAARWTYPSLWPGLHASHIAPAPEIPGELIGTTRLLGPSFRLRKASDIDLWAINGNKGNIYLFTADGLFVATLFQDARSPNSSWAQHTMAVRGTNVSGLTTGEENFWPSITQTEDGQVYVSTNFPAIIRVDGLDTIRRFTPWTIQVSSQMLEQARNYFEDAELNRQRVAPASRTLIVPVTSKPLPMDPTLSGWDSTLFVPLDERTNLVGNWSRSKAQTVAALRIGGDRLYAAFKTGDSKALENAGTAPQNLFKTGGALDVMLATNPDADPNRRSAAAGDIRLLVSIVKGKPIAVLYRQVVASGPRQSALFESPLRSIKFDDVEDVTRDLQLVSGGSGSPVSGNFEFSIPITVLGLKQMAGASLLGDLGLLRGDGLRTTQRVYWSNKATGLVSDVPSEAELTPQLWGKIHLVADPASPAQHEPAERHAAIPERR